MSAISLKADPQARGVLGGLRSRLSLPSPICQRRPRRNLHLSARKFDVGQQYEQRQSGFRFDKEEGSFRVNFNNSEVVIPEQTLLLSGLALLGAGVVIGPIVLGLIFSAISISVAVTFGALALSSVFSFFFLLFFVFFGSWFVSGGFALLGMGIFLPKLFSLIITGAGLAIGWTAVRFFLPNKPAKPSQAKAAASKKEEVIDLEAEEAKRMSQELREFDQLLAESAEKSRRKPWSKEEDDKILYFVSKNGDGAWAKHKEELGRLLPGRDPSLIGSRYRSKLRPNAEALLAEQQRPRNRT